MNQAVEDQTVETEITVTNFLPNGRFAPGNKVHEKSDRGAGYAKLGARLQHILESKTVKEIAATALDEEQLGVEGMLHKRATAAIIGDRQDAEFAFDRIEGKPTQRQELTGANGGPVAVATADVTGLLLELSNKITE